MRERVLAAPKVAQLAAAASDISKAERPAENPSKAHFRPCQDQVMHPHAHPLPQNLDSPPAYTP